MRFAALLLPGVDGMATRLPIVAETATLNRIDSLLPGPLKQEYRAMSISLPREPDFDKAGGLVPAIAQDAENGEVLMMAWMNREAFQETLATGRAVYFSRSRGKLWRKGEESGHQQEVHQILVDCDADTVLLKVDQKGAACHEGFRTCFFREVGQDETKIVQQRLVNPEDVYKK